MSTGNTRYLLDRTVRVDNDGWIIVGNGLEMWVFSGIALSGVVSHARKSVARDAIVASGRIVSVSLIVTGAVFRPLDILRIEVDDATTPQEKDDVANAMLDKLKTAQEALLSARQRYFEQEGRWVTDGRLSAEARANWLKAAIGLGGIVGFAASKLAESVEATERQTPAEPSETAEEQDSGGSDEGK
jgi:hypothetical protein